MPQQHVTTHYRTQRLCRVLQALGKARNTLGNKGHTAKKLTTKCSLHSAICRALGKAFAECRKTLGKEKHSEKNPEKTAKKIYLIGGGTHPPTPAPSLSKSQVMAFFVPSGIQTVSSLSHDLLYHSTPLSLVSILRFSPPHIIINRV